MLKPTIYLPSRRLILSPAPTVGNSAPAPVRESGDGDNRTAGEPSSPAATALAEV